MAHLSRHRRASQRGFSYAEVLLSVMLLAILLVPALQALNNGINGSAIASDLATRQLSLRSKMEEVLSKPFGTLYAETYKSDCTPTPNCNTAGTVNPRFSDPAGASNRLVVVFNRFDASTNAVSTNDTSLMYVSVYDEADGGANALNTLVGRWW